MPTAAPKVANEFLRLASERDVALTPLQLMKLVYIAHGWSLGLRQRPLITDRIEAWKYGPVIPDLYHLTKKYGSGAVTDILRSSIFSGRQPELDDDEKELIKAVYEVYGNLSGIRLSALTHRTGTPWAETYRADTNGIPISNDLIAEHYRQLGNERDSNTKRPS